MMVNFNMLAVPIKDNVGSNVGGRDILTKNPNRLTNNNAQLSKEVPNPLGFNNCI